MDLIAILSCISQNRGTVFGDSVFKIVKGVMPESINVCFDESYPSGLKPLIFDLLSHDFGVRLVKNDEYGSFELTIDNNDEKLLIYICLEHRKPVNVPYIKESNVIFNFKELKELIK